MKTPNLFLVGAPKTGTTSLHNYLAQHQEIFMSTDKEPHYFCKDFHKESDEFHKKKKFYVYRTLQEYLKLFEKAENEKIVGESSTRYLYSQFAPKDIFRFDKNAKIIIGIREPVDFLYSVFLQNSITSGETFKDFKFALEIEKERRKNNKHISISQNVNAPSELFYSDLIDFDKHIREYLKIFPKKNVKIFLFEDFVRNTEKVYKEILKFLEVDDSFVPDFKVYNKTSKVRFMFIHKYFINPNLPIKRYFKKILPKKFQVSLYNFFSNLNQKGFKKNLDPNFRLELMKKYRPAVTQLSKFLNKENLIDKDLVKFWGYDKI